MLFIAASDRSGGARQILARWDGQWYARIAANGYGTVRTHPDGRTLADYAFFPLYPGLERLLGVVTGLDFVTCGWLISVVAAPAAALGVFRVVAAVTDARTACISVCLWGSLPVAAVQTMAYTESLFTAFSAWALYAVDRERWILAGTLAASAALTRPTGVAVTSAVGCAAVVNLWQQRNARLSQSARSGARSWAPVVALIVSSTGSVAFPAWVAVDRGSPTAYFQVTAGWENEFDGGRGFAAWVLALLGSPASVGLGILVSSAVLGLAWLLLACIRLRLPPAHIVYATTLLVLAFGTSGYFGSKPRYLVPAFVLLVPVATWVAARSQRSQRVILSVAAASSIAYGTVWLLGPGPL